MCKADPLLTGEIARAMKLHQLLLVQKVIRLFRLGLRYHLVKHTEKLGLEKVLPKIKCCLHPSLTKTLSAESHSALNPDTGCSRMAVPAV